MTMPLAKRRFSIEEYLRMEEKAVDRHEYHDGEIRMMSGGTYSHSIINANLIRSLGNHLEGMPCPVFESNMRLRIGMRAKYLYPDAGVVCGEPTFDPKN